jgi:antitoxin CcdA
MEASSNNILAYNAHDYPTNGFAMRARSVQAAKKATNITLSQEVVADAKALGLNLSQTCERLLRETIRAEKERRWASEHADFIAAYNQRVQDEGVVLDDWRMF